MKKLWMSSMIAVLAFVFVFTFEANSFATNHVGNQKVSTYIKGKRNLHWTKAISANSNYKLYVVVENYNKFNVAYYIKDAKTNKFVKFSDGAIIKGQQDKGTKKYIIKGVNGQYKLKLYCADKSPYPWGDDNSKKCNAKATVYNYKPKNF
ncbi:hypothetical protein MK805_16565 [Shimazuella sp. AN120528]|uniref:hypothetical protein n=1 Tax=Shimazuella soli TaxID=1892854 RepID=UPI001F107CCD|nr:hypothetical protein [Shimazuella soli]MCH5586553.1 hypothetical protein [Shimazuella soli]